VVRPELVFKNKRLEGSVSCRRCRPATAIINSLRDLHAQRLPSVIAFSIVTVKPTLEVISAPGSPVLGSHSWPVEDPFDLAFNDEVMPAGE
jgi:hypothetical protein